MCGNFWKKNTKFGLLIIKKLVLVVPVIMSKNNRASIVFYKCILQI